MIWQLKRLPAFFDFFAQFLFSLEVGGREIHMFQNDFPHRLFQDDPCHSFCQPVFLNKRHISQPSPGFSLNFER